MEGAERDQAEKDREGQMAHSGRDQAHLGIDTNVLVAYLDKDHPSHRETGGLAEESVALNPMIVHEAFHSLVFKMKWTPQGCL